MALSTVKSIVNVSELLFLWGRNVSSPGGGGRKNIWPLLVKMSFVNKETEDRTISQPRVGTRVEGTNLRPGLFMLCLKRSAGGIKPTRANKACHDSSLGLAKSNFDPVE